MHTQNARNTTNKRLPRHRRHHRPAPPPAPEWLLEQGLNRDAPPVQIHVGGCWNAGKRSRGISRYDALRALADGVRACGACRPDAELGYLKA
ncbi:DUF6233 domain-containing protein [Streptomyces lancefieldiae]|uniref:DUF6233 domain-containing protein n=1 Tax=Streptomyces lancefieldiae TaxID=3075520 RepID=A0ABU3B1U7_9ACTN|nr:DUF6233 domain-containing protein [Streptomyces sp. DSM 40712]MDT0616432.1 DUF6233 domain-containing protein [Streptomyces sp. DSM 40712]